MGLARHGELHLVALGRERRHARETCRQREGWRCISGTGVIGRRRGMRCDWRRRWQLAHRSHGWLRSKPRHDVLDVSLALVTSVREHAKVVRRCQIGREKRDLGRPPQGGMRCRTRIADLYHEALERPPAERGAFLDAACDGNYALRREVQSLLGYEVASARFLELPAAVSTVRPHERPEARRWWGATSALTRSSPRSAPAAWARAIAPATASSGVTSPSRSSSYRG